MKICSRCFYTSKHPLYITFDGDGVCSGCRVHEEKDKIDWSERSEKLRSIFAIYKNHSGSNYDCIIPVSGGRDSFFIVHTVKNIFGMNPLLVSYNKQYNTAAGIRNLAKLRIEFDCDLMLLTTNPEATKTVTRATLRRFGSIYWHCIAGQTVYPVQMAVKFKIPLIVWGAHQGVEQVGMFSHLDEVEMTRKYRKEHDLMGIEAEDLISEFDDVREEQIVQYRYPDSKEIEQVGVRGIYLNNYIRWDSRVQHEKMIVMYGYETRSQARTFDRYHDADCWVYSDIHDHLKFIKHGYSIVTDHVCREIRLRRMSRDEGADIIRRYETQTPQNTEKFLSWIGMTANGFDYITDQHRGEIWRRDANWDWRLKVNILDAVERSEVKKAMLDNVRRHSEYATIKRRESLDSPDDYILIGKGHILGRDQ